MEANMKYPLNPLAACFVPLSMKAHTANINLDVHSIDLWKSLPHGAQSASKTKTTKHSNARNLDLICKKTTLEDRCFVSKSSEVHESVHDRATPEKMIGDEASIDRSEDRTNIEKMDLMEQKEKTDNCSMEFERTSNMAYGNTDSFETERTSNVKNTDPIKMNSTSCMANENTDSETVQAGNLYSILERCNNKANIEPGQFEKSRSDSMQSTKSFNSDYGTDLENMDAEDCSGLLTEMLPSVKSCETVESEREATSEIVPGSLERDLNLQMKSSVYKSLTSILGAVLPSKTGKAKTCWKEMLNTKPKRECTCPPMFGWVTPFEYFGNPLNLTETCNKNYAHIGYKHTNDHKSRVQAIYRKSLDYGKHSIDSGHCSEEDEPSSSVEDNTLEQCSSELESIIKDVFDCVDKSLSLCEDEKPHTANKNSEVWIKTNETEVFQVKDSPLVDDGYHPLLEETTSEDVDVEILVIEKFLGEALTFGDKHDNERYSSQSSCIPPCSVWCTNVPPPVIDTYKRFVKKIDSELVNHNVADEKKVFRKPVYKRCFSANDTPKSFDNEVLGLTSSWETKRQFYRKDLAEFNDSKDTANNNLSSNFSTGQLTNPLKEGSNTWSLCDSADSLWQPLPDCVVPSDNSQKCPYKRVRIMRRQKSVG